MEGTIIRLMPTKGFGFLRDPHGNTRFFHVKECIGGTALFDFLREGEAVDFEPCVGQKGLRATNVRRLSEEA